MKYLKSATLIFIFFAFSSNAYAQSDSFYAFLDKALNKHIQSQGIQDSFSAIADFEQAIKDYPGRWEPHFWASYVNTQIARGISNTELAARSITRDDLLVSSQQHLDTIKEEMINASSELKSDYHTLQSLIYTFENAFAQSDQEQFEYGAKEKAEMNEALKANPENPVAWVLIGSDMYSAGLRDGDYGKVTAARVILTEAGKMFDAQKKTYITQTTHWNASWYKYWLGRSDRFLKGTL